MVSLSIVGYQNLSFAQENLSLTPLGTYESGIFDNGGAEIISFDYSTQRIFVTNDGTQSIDVLSIQNPGNPTLEFSIDITPYGHHVNSIDINKKIIAAAIEPQIKDELGNLVFFDIDGNYLNHVQVGYLPDMVVFTPLGNKVLVANEGEPISYCTIKNDPEGSISIVDISNGVQNPVVMTADFSKFNGQKEELRDKGIRISTPTGTVAQDLEPEYITVLLDHKTAAITLQENNAIAILDIDSAQITDLIPLGHVDHSVLGNEIDVSDKDGKINISNWPVKGLRQPDGIDSFVSGNDVFLVTANEGDPRTYDCMMNYNRNEDVRVYDIKLDTELFPNQDILQKSDQLGRLKVSMTEGDYDKDGDFDELYSFGTRSFSILTLDGQVIYDSGSDFEQITASLFPNNFNSNHYHDDFDKRSDNRGIEPEGIIVERIGAKQFAFIGLERMGGIMVYDVTDPYNPEFVEYTNNRGFSVKSNQESKSDGIQFMAYASQDSTTNTSYESNSEDLGPEGLLFISKYQSPTNNPLLVVANEVSGTTTIYEVR